MREILNEFFGEINTNSHKKWRLKLQKVMCSIEGQAIQQIRLLAVCVRQFDDFRK